MTKEERAEALKRWSNENLLDLYGTALRGLDISNPDSCETFEVSRTEILNRMKGE